MSGMSPNLINSAKVKITEPSIKKAGSEIERIGFGH